MVGSHTTIIHYRGRTVRKILFALCVQIAPGTNEIPPPTIRPAAAAADRTGNKGYEHALRFPQF